MLGKHGLSWAGLAIAILAGVSPVARGNFVTLDIPDVPDIGGGAFTETTGTSGDYYEETTNSTNNLIVFAQVEFSNSATDDFAEEFAGASADNQIILTNDPASIDIINVDYYLSPTYIPLDDLNFGASPPSYDGSPFTPLPSLDGTTLQDGASESADISTPLPASVKGGLALLIAVGGISRFRQRAPVA